MSRRPPHAEQQGADLPLCVRLAVVPWALWWRGVAWALDAGPR